MIAARRGLLARENERPRVGRRGVARERELRLRVVALARSVGLERQLAVVVGDPRGERAAAALLELLGDGDGGAPVARALVQVEEGQPRLGVERRPGERLVGLFGAIEQARFHVVLGGVERKFWKVTLAPSLNIQQNVPFSYIGEIDPSLTMLRLSYLELASTLDLRDNPNLTHAGAYSQVLMQATSGTPRSRRGRRPVSDYKVRGELRGYVPLARRTTLALRGTLGALWPDNWGDTLDDPVPSNNDIQISYFRSFFSGGPNSNRGWPSRGIGKQGIAPFLSPGVTEAQLTTECSDADPDDVRCRTPVRRALALESSLEVRQRLINFEGILFCDASDASGRR